MRRDFDKRRREKRPDRLVAVIVQRDAQQTEDRRRHGRRRERIAVKHGERHAVAGENFPNQRRIRFEARKRDADFAEGGDGLFAPKRADCARDVGDFRAAIGAGANRDEIGRRGGNRRFGGREWQRGAAEPANEAADAAQRMKLPKGAIRFGKMIRAERHV